MSITDNLKCPNCHRKGYFEIIIRKKYAVARCGACHERLEERVPYPKHRVDHEDYQYHFEIGSVRPIWTEDDDNITCSQEEWENRHT